MKKWNGHKRICLSINVIFRVSVVCILFLESMLALGAGTKTIYSKILNSKMELAVWRGKACSTSFTRNIFQIFGGRFWLTFVKSRNIFCRNDKFNQRRKYWYNILWLIQSWFILHQWDYFEYLTEYYPWHKRGKVLNS